MTIDRDPERLQAADRHVRPLLHARREAELGRFFTAADEVYGQNWIPVAISDRIWNNRGDRNVLGKTLRINGRTRRSAS